MFAIPLVAAPFLLLLVPYRLFKILRALLRREMAFSATGRPLLPVLTALAYAGLAMQTAWVLLAVARLASSGDWSLHGVEPLLILGGTYPLSYVAAEWIFFYGLKKVATPPMGPVGT